MRTGLPTPTPTPTPTPEAATGALPGWLGPAAMVAGPVIGGLISGYYGNKAADEASRAAWQAGNIQQATGQQLLDINLTSAMPGYGASVTALAGIMDMLGLDRSSLAAAGQGAVNDRANRPYPAPPNWWGQGPEAWRARVDEYYDDPKGMRQKYEGKVRHDGGYYYIRDQVNDFYQGLGENAYGDNVATLIDPQTGLPVPYGMGPTGGAGAGGGMGQLADVANLIGTAPTYDWQASPAYDWRFNEGQRALNQSLVSQGGALSGGAVTEAIGYGQDMASQEYQNIMANLFQLAGYGAPSQQQITIGSQGYGNLMGDSAVSAYTAGANRAGGYMAQGNTWATALNEISTGLGNWFTAKENQNNPLALG